jgi:phage terminase large subunit
VFSEFAVAKSNTWELIRPMLRENGGWAAFITTPRGRNHAWKLFNQADPASGWFRDVQTVRHTSQSIRELARTRQAAQCRGDDG